MVYGHDTGGKESIYVINLHGPDKCGLSTALRQVKKMDMSGNNWTIVPIFEMDKEIENIGDTVLLSQTHPEFASQVLNIRKNAIIARVAEEFQDAKPGTILLVERGAAFLHNVLARAINSRYFTSDLSHALDGAALNVSRNHGMLGAISLEASTHTIKERYAKEREGTKFQPQKLVRMQEVWQAQSYYQVEYQSRLTEATVPVVHVKLEGKTKEQMGPMILKAVDDIITEVNRMEKKCLPPVKGFMPPLPVPDRLKSNTLYLQNRGTFKPFWVSAPWLKVVNEDNVLEEQGLLPIKPDAFTQFHNYTRVADKYVHPKQKKGGQSQKSPERPLPPVSSYTTKVIDRVPTTGSPRGLQPTVKVKNMSVVVPRKDQVTPSKLAKKKTTPTKQQTQTSQDHKRTLTKDLSPKSFQNRMEAIRKQNMEKDRQQHLSKVGNTDSSDSDESVHAKSSTSDTSDSQKDHDSVIDLLDDDDSMDMEQARAIMNRSSAQQHTDSDYAGHYQARTQAASPGFIEKELTPSPRPEPGVRGRSRSKKPNNVNRKVFYHMPSYSICNCCNYILAGADRLDTGSGSRQPYSGRPDVLRGRRGGRDDR